MILLKFVPSKGTILAIFVPFEGIYGDTIIYKAHI